MSHGTEKAGEHNTTRNDTPDRPEGSAMDLKQAMAVVAKHDVAVRATPAPVKPAADPRIENFLVAISAVLSMFLVFGGAAAGVVLAVMHEVSVAGQVLGLFGGGVGGVGLALGILCGLDPAYQAYLDRRDKKMVVQNKQREIEYREDLNQHLETRKAAQAELDTLFEGTDYGYQLTDAGVKLVSKEALALSQVVARVGE